MLEAAYNSVAVLGDTEAPGNPEDEIDFHYVCFVKSHLNDNLYLMDGDRSGPSVESILPDADLLSTQGMEMIRRFIEKYKGGGNISLLALASAPT